MSFFLSGMKDDLPTINSCSRCGSWGDIDFNGGGYGRNHNKSNYKSGNNIAGENPPTNMEADGLRLVAMLSSNNKYSGSDADLAKEMNQLSVEEREKVYDDIHGVATVPEETPEFIETCIRKMDESIQNIPILHRKAYNQALFLYPKLATDTKFKLMFLRADQFDTRKAANRFTQYYEYKCMLFGEDKLIKRITIDDLSDEDLNVFRTGLISQLSGTDRTGRPVLFSDASKLDFDLISFDGVIRCMWYQWMSAVLDDDIAQKMGCCGVTYFPDFISLAKKGLIAKITELSKRTTPISNAVPMRFSSLHFCYDDSRIEFFTQTIRLVVPKYTRLRVRAHYGSDVENEYALMAFGIQSHELLQRSRIGVSSVHEEYIQRRKLEDQWWNEGHAKTIGELPIDSPASILSSTCTAESSSTGGIGHDTANVPSTSSQSTSRPRSGHSVIIPFPDSKDVLIGRGRSFQKHVGNRRWLSIVDDHVDRFMKCQTRFEKTCLSIDVVNTVKKYNGRFLQREPGIGWTEIDDITARKKASDSLQRAKLARSETGVGVGAATKTRTASMSSDSVVVYPPTITSSSSSYDNNDRDQNGAKRMRYDTNL